MALDVDKIDTNIRHAAGILDLVMDNVGHRIDSSQDSVEYALWSAKKHLDEAINAISNYGDERLSKVLSDMDDSSFEDDEGEDEEAEEDSDIPQPVRERVELFLRRDGKITAMKEHYE